MPGPPHPDTVHRPAAAAATGPQPLGACEQQGDRQTRPMRLSGFTSRALLSLPPAFVSCLWLPSQCRPGCNIDYLSSQIWKLGTPHRRRGQTAQKPPSGPPRWKRHTHTPPPMSCGKSLPGPLHTGLALRQCPALYGKQDTDRNKDHKLLSPASRETERTQPAVEPSRQVTRAKRRTCQQQRQQPGLRQSRRRWGAARVAPDKVAPRR